MDLTIVTNNNVIDLWDQIIISATGKAERSVIQQIEKEQEHLITCPKQLGASSWFVIECYKLPNNVYAVRFEEGHIFNYLIIIHNVLENKFYKLVESGTETE
ncbi:hypothetical protein [Cohnella fermenti]|uniref:Uncharacterized protein n=1 Tax=Cohnella fermenti TaxID=2565925 RepID=A0A4S4CAW5_9BACL|nr:hypothetical protein [Cohnella fermenti]THF84608.1 hypothetical protein E6C55_01100 [Cohnella fermenti]